MASSQAEINRKLREAQRKAEQAYKRDIDKINRDNKRVVDQYNRKVDEYNRKLIQDVNSHNRKVDEHNKQINRDIDSYNRRANQHNKRIISDLNAQLRSSLSPVRYTESERQLADRVHQAISTADSREYDSFLSYARIDGSQVAHELRGYLDDLGVVVWFDEIAIIPGRSQSLQMDAGLRKARTGIVLLTPAYLTGRFWTERELGVLLNKPTLIPVLHNVTFNDVREYSGILPDLAGFTTEQDSISDIAQKIAAAVLPSE
ncbi:toll/interleukin-1 receptor domain-containing protein [Pseudomonas sp.]|uniref:toll/interleukin-1 receptor domain-containing protein n=1 Tax=Pseudomonas sp. TaxID=306 RepID=UPI0028A90D88|nr:toll/interleukin-1 receptor domain-containing protein [Pseudomonas sp.]